MTPAQFIKISQERLQDLYTKINTHRAHKKAYGIRCKFAEKPSIDIIISREEQKYPDPKITEMYYKELYRANDEENTRETPIFNKWLERMAGYRNIHRAEN